MNIEEIRKKSIEQFAVLRKKALNEAYLNTPIRSAAGSSSSGGGVPPEPIEPNFDVTATNWANWNVVDEASFITFLESGGGDGGREKNSFTGIIVTDFTFVDGRIRCNLTATSNGAFYLNELGITNVLSLGNTTYTGLRLYGNNLSEFNVILSSACITLDLTENDFTTFDPIYPLPNLIILNLSYNQLTTFNPSLQLPNTLDNLRLNDNLITEFDPDLPLPSGLKSLFLNNNELTFFNPLQWSNTIFRLNLSDNLITRAGYAASEPWANRLGTAPPSAEIEVARNPDSIVGTDLYDILLSKGWSFVI